MKTRIRLHLARRLVLAAGLGLLLALLLVGPPAHLGAPEEASSPSLAGPATPPADPPSPPDEDELAQTRWISIDGRQPISFQQWRAGQPPPAPLRVERVYASPTLSSDAASEQVVCALVNPLLYEGIAASLARWAADVEREGWSAVIYSASFPDPPSLRAHLASIAGLQGCLLVGDLPIPWFRLGAKEFPFDLYYMDLDGVWHDDDGDGLYEDHSGDIVPEIWIGRMTAGNLTFGRDEAGLVNNYFRKNHAYRTGDLVLPARALVYVDDPWARGGDSQGRVMSLLYPDTTVISETNTTRADDYGRRLDDDYAWIHLLAHSTAGYHVFGYSEENPLYARVIYNENIHDIDPHAFFYNLFACGAARFTEADYIAGWYVFADTYGLVALGTTTSGGMVRGFADFHEPLARGEPLGTAYMSWYEEWGITDPGWHSGLTMLGDPTLVVDTTDVPGEAPTALTLAGPTRVSIGLAHPFTATAEPPTATLPLRFTWQVTGTVPIARNGGLQDAASLTWTAPGLKTVAVTATNYAGTVTGALTLTVEAPAVEIAPRALSETLVLGTALTRSLTLSNAGPGDLAFRLAETERTLSAGVGPDPFGYTTLDSNQPHGPAYRWIEIAPPAGGGGVEVTALTGASGGYAYPIPLPFTFNYYGRDYDELALYSDGVLSWSNRPANHLNLPIPSARGFEMVEFLAPFWDDLTINPGAVYVQEMGSAFVIEYYRVSRQGYTTDPGAWEVILYDSGSILFQYQDVDLGGTAADHGKSATVGIQGDALTGLQYSYNTSALSAGLAICFAYPGQLPDCSTPFDAPWLSVGPMDGAVTAGGQRSIDLVLDASTPHVTQPGLYRAALVALTNDPEESLVAVPVTMTVIAPTYGVALSPRLDARSGRPGGTVTYTLHLTNTGNLSDVFDLAVDDAAWPVAMPTVVGPLAAASSTVVAPAVQVPSTAAGGATDRATLRVTSRGDSSRWMTATWTTAAENVYDLVVAPVAAARSGQPGTVVTYTLYVTNTGNAPDVFDIVLGDNAWPTAAPATVGSLGRNDGADLDVVVAIPPDAAHGATDTATLTVISRGQSARWVTATLTTTAEVPQPPWRDLFLPLIVRSPAG